MQTCSCCSTDRTVSTDVAGLVTDSDARCNVLFGFGAFAAKCQCDSQFVRVSARPAAYDIAYGLSQNLTADGSSPKIMYHVACMATHSRLNSYTSALLIRKESLKTSLHIICNEHANSDLLAH